MFEDEPRVYIPYPSHWPSSPFSGERRMPEDVRDWLKGKNPNFGVMNGKEVGIFLRSEDAVAFKLTFKL